MTLLVDPRAGSSALLAPLCTRGLEAEGGDPRIRRCGRLLAMGPEGTVLVGIEYKHMGEAITCMTSGRFAGHQLLGMARLLRILAC